MFYRAPAVPRNPWIPLAEPKGFGRTPVIKHCIKVWCYTLWRRHYQRQTVYIVIRQWWAAHYHRVQVHVDVGVLLLSCSSQGCCWGCSYRLYQVSTGCYSVVDDRQMASRCLYRSSRMTSVCRKHITTILWWWCSGWASDSWSKGRWFDSRPGRYQVN